MYLELRDMCKPHKTEEMNEIWHLYNVITDRLDVLISKLDGKEKS